RVSVGRRRNRVSWLRSLTPSTVTATARQPAFSARFTMAAVASHLLVFTTPGPHTAKSHGYFASEGGLTDGPLLFPGCPGILDESCWRTARLWSLMSEPVVSPEGFTAGPLLLPGLPGIPAPEFCPPLGAVTWPPPEGAVVCAEAGSVTIASAAAPMSNLNM